MIVRRNYNYRVVLAVVVASMLAMNGVVYGDLTVGLDSSSPVGGCNPFSENFNDGVADNWFTDGSGTWDVIFGVYRMTGITPASSAVRYTYYNGDSSDFTYQARLRKTSGDTSSAMGIYFRSSDGAE